MRDIRNETILLCGVDGARFKLVDGKYSTYYRCPKYELVHRINDEKVCMNRLSLDDAKLIYSELEEMEEDGSLKAGNGGRIYHLQYKIAQITEHFITVFVVNMKKIKI